MRRCGESPSGSWIGSRRRARSSTATWKRTAASCSRRWCIPVPRPGTNRRAPSGDGDRGDRGRVGLVSVALEQARAALGKARLVWIDADSRGPEVEALLRDLGVHPLTIEDVFETRTVPK